MVYLYIGVPGSGKSTLLRRHVYETEHATTFLIVDRDLRKTWWGPVFKSAAEFRNAATLPRWCVFQGVPGVQVAELALELGDCVYVDEDVTATIAERPWRPWTRADRGRGHPLFTLLHEGRHYPDAFGVSREVSALIATHRPANLPLDLPALCNGVYLGKLLSYTDATRCYREGWLPEAAAPRHARRILEARQVGEFSFVRGA